MTVVEASLALCLRHLQTDAFQCVSTALPPPGDAPPRALAAGVAGGDEGRGGGGRMRGGGMAVSVAMVGLVQLAAAFFIGMALARR